MTVGTRVVVRPGERLALDGVVTAGASSVDQAPITGESVPVDKLPGDDVFAGTLNGHGALTVRVTRPAAESTLSRVAALVEAAQASRAPAERFIDRFARIYTPLVFAAALALATVPLAVRRRRSTPGPTARLALLIVACPCSLVISVPVAVVSAVGGAARRGILIKGGQALEDLAAVRAVAIDKTGTLTLGLPQLTSLVAIDGTDPDEALRLVAAVERNSEHPLAAALRRAARERGARRPAARRVPGPARARRHRVASTAGGCGPAARGSCRTAPASRQTGMRELHEAGQTAIALGEDDRVLALFGLADQARPEAAQLAARLRDVGVRQLVMLTGDSEPVARAVARRAGIDDVPRRAAPGRQAGGRRGDATASSPSRWSATASTTPPRSPPPTSASPWAPPAATSPWRAPTSR